MHFVSSLKEHFSEFFTKGHQRSIEVKKNIAASFLIKGVSISISLVLVPLTINYINPTQYGIWLTLSSIVAWFSFFDMGFGNGMRNRFAEVKANGDMTKARAYVSTTYAVLGIIFGAVWFIFFVVNFFIDWSVVLNAPSNLAKELSTLALIVVSFFCLQIVLKTITTVLIADQKPAKASFFDMLGQLLALIIIFVLTKTTKGSLLYLGSILGFIPVLVLLCSSIYFYSSQYKDYSPSMKYVRFGLLKDIMSLGYKFFVIQIAGIILFTTTNILITQFYGPGDVTSYNIAFKYFSVVTMTFGIIIAPFWSAITDAYARKELQWIRTAIKKLNIIALIFIILCLLMLLVADKVFLLWIGPSVKVPLSVSIMMAIYFIISLLAGASNTFINGTGKIQIQFLASIFAIIVTIPLSFLFCKYLNFGPAGVIASTLCTTFPCMILYRIQYKKIITGAARGIWNN